MTDIDVNLDELDIDSDELSTEESAHMASITVETPVKKERKPRAKKMAMAEMPAHPSEEYGSAIEMPSHDHPIAGSPVAMAEKGQPVCQSTKPLARLMQMRKELKSILPDSHAEEGYTYVSLSKVIRTVTDVAYAHGFAIVERLRKSVISAELWDIESNTKLTKSSEEIMARSGYSKIQDRGAEITYARRYVYMSLVGITVDRDNDGKAAKPNTTVLAPKGSVDAQKEGFQNRGIPLPGCSGQVIPHSRDDTSGKPVFNPEQVSVVCNGAALTPIAAEELEKTINEDTPQATPPKPLSELAKQLKFQWDEMKAANKTHLVTEHNFKIIEAVCKGERTLKDEMLITTCAHLAAKMAGK